MHKQLALNKLGAVTADPNPEAQLPSFLHSLWDLDSLDEHFVLRTVIFRERKHVNLSPVSPGELGPLPSISTRLVAVADKNDSLCSVLGKSCECLLNRSLNVRVLPVQLTGDVLQIESRCIGWQKL